ncbi:MAG: anthranilate synthase component 1 [Myxococcales bacterium]|nr:anthranilate synthase component 1 [Myxococcales bacterium]USN51702.1 MAG: anthranilate synthase component 1 [Myxococcales bacterium]
MTSAETSKYARFIRSEIDGVFDPVELIQLHVEAEVILLESADVITKLGEKSILLLEPALRVEARNKKVFIEALEPEGEELLPLLKKSLGSWLIESSKKTLTLGFSPLFNEFDVLEKMRMPSKLEVLRAVLKAIDVNEKDRAALMLSGIFSYDFIDHFENLSPARNDHINFPDYLFYLPLSGVVIEHPLQRCSIFSWTFEDKNTQLRSQSRFKKLEHEVKNAVENHCAKKIFSSQIHCLDRNTFAVDVNDQEFGKMIEQCKEYIDKGDVYQIVPSRTFFRKVDNALLSYQALRYLNPSPHMFYLSSREWTLLGASPETFIKVDQGGRRLFIRPIAGTRRRGLDSNGIVDPELDMREQVSLCIDEKELSEHMMLVDLARNDIAGVSKPGTRRLRRLLAVDRFSHVMHLVSEVEGILKNDCDALLAYQMSMNMGTLMGAPKVRAAELLRQIENSKRGFYGGAIGYIDKNGDMDTAIIIRSALIKDEQAFVRAGCGVVYDSNIDFETQETLNKAEAVLKALELAQRS